MFQSRIIHVIPEPTPIVPITEQISQFLKGLFCAAAEQGPGFTQPINWSALERTKNRELTVEVVELVETLPDLDKVGHGVGSRPGILVLQDLLNKKEGSILAQKLGTPPPPPINIEHIRLC